MWNNVIIVNYRAHRPIVFFLGFPFNVLGSTNIFRLSLPFSPLPGRVGVVSAKPMSTRGTCVKLAPFTWRYTQLERETTDGSFPRWWHPWFGDFPSRETRVYGQRWIDRYIYILIYIYIYFNIPLYTHDGDIHLRTGFESSGILKKLGWTHDFPEYLRLKH